MAELDKREKAGGITFKELEIKGVRDPKKLVFLAFRNGRCSVTEGLDSLSAAEIKEIRSILRGMVSIENYRSSKLKWNLKKYKYGEIKPWGKRIFFFQKCGDNIILFDFRLKKKDSLGDKVYQQIDKERQEYEREFERYFQERF